MRILKLVVLFLFFYGSSYSQVPGLKNFSTLDGLPSDEVYKSLIDDKGYLWFATNSGVCYFDGEKFHTLDISDGLIENTILEMELDKNGRIWFVGISGNLCYYNHGKISSFSGNAAIQKFRNNVEINVPGGFIPIDTNEIYILFNRGKKIHIKDRIADCKDIKQGDTIRLTKNNDQYRFSFCEGIDKKSLVFIANLGDTITSFDFTNKYLYSSIINYNLYQEFDDKLIYFLERQAVIFYKSGKIEVKELDFSPVFTIKGVFGGIWIGTQKKGLMFFPDLDFSKEPSVHFLIKQYITSLRYDQNNRGWVTTLNSGVFYVQALAITNYYFESEGIADQIKAILKLDDGSILAFTNVNKVYYIEETKQIFKTIHIEELQNELVYKVLKFGEKIYVATTSHFVVIPLSVFTNSQVKEDDIKSYEITNIKDFITQDSILWIATSSGISYFPYLIADENIEKFRLENIKDSRVTRIISYVPKETLPNYSYIIYHDLNTLWRLRYHKSDPKNYQSAVFKTEDQLFITSFNDIKYWNHDILLGTKGRGLIWMKDDTILYYDKDDGLISNYIKKMEFDRDSNLILATNKGINILSFTSDKYPQLKSFKKITTNDGMRGKDVNDFVLQGSKIIAATNFGLSYINHQDVLQIQDQFPIHILQFKVNEKNFLEFEKNEYELKYWQNNISISFDALDFHDKKNITYYYQLTGAGDDTWKAIDKPEVVFPLLSAGEYGFEVKAQNSYGYRSENSATIQFSIDKVFYKKWWFRIGFVLLFLGLLSSSFILYFTKRNETLQNEKVLADFHQKSLTRLLNPHFMSNALNTVNSFIMNNKKTEATDFIKQIGKFIRQIYSSAYYKDISLKEEASLLTTYLKIEQRRSNSRFNFLIKVDQEIEDVRIPSFMTQLFVENSVVHGFSDLKPRGGLITVIFKNKPPFIYCEIIDNGIGRVQALKYKKSNLTKGVKHGLDIIEERIQLLNTKFTKTKIGLKIVDLYSEKTGIATGTKILLTFPYIKS